MPSHIMLSGETLEYPTPPAPLATYLAKLRDAVDDPSVDEARFIELVYSPENPLLDATIMPGRGTVTKAAFADPTYHVMLDLLGRKRVALGSLDMNEVRARYSLSVKDAAARAGCSPDAIRKAIASHRLSSVKVKGEHFLDPAQVDAYKPATHGPTPPLEVTWGSEPGKTLMLKHDGERVEDSREASVHHGRVERWSRVAVLAGTKEKARYWLLEPGATVEELGLPPFIVRGRFKVAASSNNTTKARELFKRAEGAHAGRPPGGSAGRPGGARAGRHAGGR